MLKNVLALHEVRVDDVMVPRADIVAVSVEATLAAKCWPSSAPPAIRACRSTARRSTIRAAWSTSATSWTSSPPSRASASSVSRRREAAPTERKAVAEFGMNTPLSAAQHPAPGAVRAALDAGARSAGEDAGDAHAYGAGDRRIWRHRRARLDRGHGRDDRRRHRGRARRGRAAADRRRRRRRLHRRSARAASRTSPRRSASISRRSPTPRTSTRSAASSTAAAGRVPIRGEIVASPGDLEFEILDADPRRVKRLRVQQRAAPRRRSAAARALAEPNRPPESGAAPGDK